MRIAVDALGGDNAPREVVAGALAAAEKVSQDHLILVGGREVVEPLLGDDPPSNLSVEGAEGSIGMDEGAAANLRSRPNSSISVAARLLKSGEAEALYSAGSTGATVAAGLLGVGRIRGVRRPAIATVLPLDSPVLLLDAGATVQCRAEDLRNFAVMGSVFARRLMGVNEPKVGLINVGEEPGKGNELVKEAHNLLSDCATIRFVGNVEGRDIGSGAADVLVADGFTGNVVLKTAEGIAREVLLSVRAAITDSLFHRLAAGVLRSRLVGVRDRLDPESYGGSFLLGVSGAIVIGHGNTGAGGVENGLLAVSQAGGGLAGELEAAIRAEEAR